MDCLLIIHNGVNFTVLRNRCANGLVYAFTLVLLDRKSGTLMGLCFAFVFQSFKLVIKAFT